MRQRALTRDNWAVLPDSALLSISHNRCHDKSIVGARNGSVKAGRAARLQSHVYVGMPK